jgi:hypothetical protein
MSHAAPLGGVVETLTLGVGGVRMANVPGRPAVNQIEFHPFWHEEALIKQVQRFRSRLRCDPTSF